VWIGFDFDGTLVDWPDGTEGRSYGPDHPHMVVLLKELVSAGLECRIFTARAADPVHLEIVKKWLEERGVGHLAVTDRKDFELRAIIDDLAITVIEDKVLTAPDAVNLILNRLGLKLEKELKGKSMPN